MRIAVIDDRPADRDYIAALVSRWAKDRDTAVTAVPFPSAEAFLFDYSEDKNFDILLLDIEMGAINGVELAKTVRAENDAVQMVFITGFPDFIAEGYEVSAVHYLMKPVDQDKLFSALDRAAANLVKSERRLHVTFERRTDYVPFSKILYLEAQKQYVRIVTEGEEYRMKASLAETAAQLDEFFFPCQRSFIVNLRHVARILPDRVVLKNGAEVPISRGVAEKIGREIIHLF
ncbi:MAG: response regulator transcription factor [Clostridia bacterium]|nr:response regulator transcription factor [Clostridia bacterium]